MSSVTWGGGSHVISEIPILFLHEQSCPLLCAGGAGRRPISRLLEAFVDRREDSDVQGSEFGHTHKPSPLCLVFASRDTPPPGAASPFHPQMSADRVQLLAPRCLPVGRAQERTEQRTEALCLPLSSAPLPPRSTPCCSPESGKFTCTVLRIGFII